MALSRLLLPFRPPLQGRTIIDLFPVVLARQCLTCATCTLYQHVSGIRGSNRQFSSSPGHSIGIKGFNRTAIEDEFDMAVQRLKQIRPEFLSTDTNLDLYAYYMQALYGPCTQPQPIELDFFKRAKWSVWNDLGDMTKVEAMGLLVSTVNVLWANRMSGTSRRSESKARHGSDVHIIGTKQDVGKAILSKVDRGVNTITINRPLKNNLLTVEMYEDIMHHLQEAAGNNNILVSVLTANGDYFCSGTDVESLRDVIGSGVDGEVSRRRQLMERFVATLIDHPKLLVAAVNGPAVGIGATMLGLFDFVFCSELAVFHAPSTQLGLGPDACASHTFPLIMGPGQVYFENLRRYITRTSPRVVNAEATEFLLLGRKLRSVDAYESRLVTRVLTEHTYDSSYPRLVEYMASLPQQALLASHNLIRSHERARLHAINKEECDLMEQRWHSTECCDAVMRFLSGEVHRMDAPSLPCTAGQPNGDSSPLTG